jgi:hypothetical protein
LIPGDNQLTELPQVFDVAVKKIKIAGENLLNFGFNFICSDYALIIS